MRSALLVPGAPLALAAALALLAPLWSPPARATVVVMPSLEELTHRSEVIVQGVVRDVVTLKDSQGRLITETSLEVLDGIAGAKVGDVVKIQQLGGSLGDEQAWIAGNHRFRLHEELVFFGVRLPKDPAIAIPYGIGFGIFDIVDDVDGRHVIEAGGGDVSQLVTNPDGTTAMKPVTPRRFDSLDAFKTQLRAIRDGRNAPALPQKRMLRPQLRAPTLPATPAKG